VKSGCWAKSLGDCSGKLSGEHIVSASLWTGPMIRVSGGPWGETPRDIGVSSMTAKVLCRSHNSALSSVDAAGAAAFATLGKATELTERRRVLPSHQWIPWWFGIDGPLLERWFLKTAINVCLVLREEPEWELDATTGTPPATLARLAFGREEFERPMGLYMSARVGDDVDPVEGVVTEPLWTESRRIAAMSFTFRGFRFVLNLHRQNILGIRPTAISSAEPRKGKDLLFHLSRINANVGPHRSHFIDFGWPGSTFDHFAS
jgi:hypothetical protein